MELLVSVASGRDASAAVRGGAQIIDAKDPASGALGAVSLATLDEIRAVVPGDRLVTAALGDATDPDALERHARELAAHGAMLVKVAFPEARDAAHLETLMTAAVRGCERVAGAGLVAVTYADASVSRVSQMAVVDVAARVGARGVLVDTSDKHGPGLLARWSGDEMETWVAHAHALDLFASVAGRLDGDGLLRVRESGADVAGVRGAVCDGGRDGSVSAARVRGLLELLEATSASPGERTATIAM